MTNPPYIVTRQMLASQAAKAWQAQYKAPEYRHSDKMSTLVELVALGPTPTPEQVNAVIGNSSWTRLACDQCGKEVETVIVVGHTPDHESGTALLCITCLEQAYNLAKSMRNSAP